MKHIWILTLMIVASFTVTAQRYGNHDAVNFRAVAEEEAGVIVDGKIYYDISCACFKFRENGTWVLLGGAASVPDGDKGDITVLSGVWNIDNDAVTFDKIQNITASRVLGRVSSGSGSIEELTGSQVNDLLPTFSNSTRGLVPQAGATPDPLKFLNEEGAFAVPAGGGTGSTETASTGLNKVGDDIRLGGQVNATTVSIDLVNSGKFEMTEGDYGFGIGSTLFFSGGWNLAWGDYVNLSGQYSVLNVDPVGTYMKAKATTGGSVQLAVRNSGILVTDNRTTKTGVQDAQSGYVTTPLSHATKEYVDGLIGTGGVTAIGTMDSQVKSSHGAVIGGSSLYMQTASVTVPGLVSTGAQTFNGVKTFDDIPILGAVPSTINSGLILARNSTTGALQARSDVIIASTNQTITGTKTFSAVPVISATPVTNNSTSTVLARNNSTGAIELRTDLGSSSSGVTTVGTIDSQSKSTNGAVISGSNLYMQTADATRPGLVSIGAQTLAGIKTFSSTPILAATPSSGSSNTVLARNNTTGAIELSNVTLAAGTYTPTITFSEPAITSGTVNTAQYMRVGNVVTVSGSIVFDPSFAVPSVQVIRWTLPIASNFTNSIQAAGTITEWPEGQENGTLSPESISNEIGMAMKINERFENNWYYYHYTYQIL